MDCKLFTVMDEGTEMGFIAIRLDSDITGPCTSPEIALLRAWGYWPDHAPGYMLLAEIKAGNPIRASINEYEWSRGGTEFQAYHKILANWDSLRSGDVVDVEQEREAYWAEDADMIRAREAAEAEATAD